MDLVKVVANIHAQASRVDWGLWDVAIVARFIDNFEQFLHTPQCKYGDEAAAATLKYGLDLCDESRNFALSS